MSLQGRVALVTGAGSGIGRATALRLAGLGAAVTVVDRDEAGARETAEAVERGAGLALRVVADVTRPDQIRDAVTAAVGAFGRLDVVVPNAGINGIRAPVGEITPEEWDETIATNLTGTFLTVRYTVPHLKAAGGSVVVVSSTNGTRVFSIAGFSAYNASKAGQVAFAKSAALELARYRIRVNVVCPGAIETNIFGTTKARLLEQAGVRSAFPDGTIPLTGGQMGRPEQVADLISFLASDAASHITGTEVWIDGGESLLGETGFP